MCCRQLGLGFVLGSSLVCLGGCSFSSSQDYIDLTEPVGASALVQSSWTPGTGFLIDRDERLLLTTWSSAGPRDGIEVVFPVIENGRALVRKSTWLGRGKERTVKARVLVSDPQRDLAVLQLASVPEDVPVLKLAASDAKKGTAVSFLGAGPRSSLVWAPATGTIQKIEPRRMAVEGKEKATNQAIELDAAGTLARGVSGGALLNENNEVVGIIARSDNQGGALLCTDLSEIRPVVAAVYRSFATYAYEHRSYDVALKFCDRALVIWPADALGYNERGAAWSQKDQFGKAVADYTKALQLEPRLTVAHRNRGSAYLHLGKYREAVADCSRALELQPRYLSAYYIRRAAYTGLGMNKELETDRQLITMMTEPQWKVVSSTGAPRSLARADTDPTDNSTGSAATFTDADGRQSGRGNEGYWQGSEGKRYIISGSYRPVTPGAGIPLR